MQMEGYHAGSTNPFPPGQGKRHERGCGESCRADPKKRPALPAHQYGHTYRRGMGRSDRAYWQMPQRAAGG